MDAGQLLEKKPADLTLCACGSGLRALRCCEQDFAAQPDPTHNALLAPAMERVVAARAEDKNREAARLLVEILDLAPLWSQPLLALFEIRQAEDNKKATRALAARLAAIAPQEPLALVRYAGVLVAQAQYLDAIEVARRGLLLTPRLAILHQLLGISYTESGQLQAGEQHYQLAMAFLPAEQRSPQEANLAWNLRQQGRLEEAAALYEAQLAKGTIDVRGLTGFAQVQAGRGRRQEVEPLLKAALKNAPDDRLASLLLAAWQLEQEKPEEGLALLAQTEARLAPQKLLTTERVVRARALERLGQYEEAWAIYNASREAQRSHLGQDYDPAPAQAKLAALKTTFMSGRLAAMPRLQPQQGQPLPLFLLGVAGSGTSLLERLLCRAPEINPADQHAPLPALAKLLPDLVRGLGGPDLKFPEALSMGVCGQGAEIPSLLAARYMAKLQGTGLAPLGTPFVTDRHEQLPWLLGLAGSLFPQAPVVHLLRHPLDVVLSGYTRDQVFEDNAGLTLESLAQAYDLQMQAIAHIRGQMTLRYLPVRYEALVMNPAATLQRIYNFVGLGATNAQALLAAPSRCVPRVPTYYAQTPSLLGGGVNRHRHFSAALTHVKAQLAPWIERLGYKAPEEA